MQIDALYSSSAGNLYRVDTPGVMPLLIECGVPLPKIKQALGFKLATVHGCLISHAHKDHSLAVTDLMKAGVDCYMSLETSQALGTESHRRIFVEPFKPFKIGAWRIVAFPTEHDCPGSMGFLLASRDEKLLFTTDTYFVRYRFRGLTHIMIECNYSLRTLAPDLDPVVKRRLLRSHMSLETCLDFLKAQDLKTVREIHLIHLSAGNSDAEMFKHEVEKATGKPAYVARENNQ